MQSTTACKDKRQCSLSCLQSANAKVCVTSRLKRQRYNVAILFYLCLKGIAFALKQFQAVVGNKVSSPRVAHCEACLDKKATLWCQKCGDLCAACSAAVSSKY